MDYETALQKAKDMVMAAKDVVVITRSNPSKDSMGSSLALMLGLIALEKKSVVICPDPMTVELSDFVGADKVSREFGKKNFVISLDYVDGSIEKVSYNIENKKFNLVIEHRPGYEPIQADSAQYSYQGVDADLIITVDTQNFGQLGNVYSQNKDMFATKQIINVDCHDENSNYGALNLVDPGASTTTELVAELMATIGVKLTADIATNLLNAIYDATNNFQKPNVTSMAFEVASVCLKAGGKRFGVPDTQQRPQQQFSQPQPQSAPVVEEAVQVEPAKEPKIFVNNKPVEPVKTGQRPQTPMQSGQTSDRPKPQAPSASPGQAPTQMDESKKPTEPPDDWLKPKIFKSSGSMA